MHKWRKVIIGGVLLAGFTFYTQFQKNAEPVWKVDEKNFSVVGTLHEGMKNEYQKMEELEVVENYGLLKKINQTIPLEKELRTLKIEKVWNMYGRIYVLYSLDLKERDKNEKDIPRLKIENVKFSKAEEGKEVTLRVIDNRTADEGFVYKHRLYRSMFLVPINEAQDREDWFIYSNADRIEMQNLSLSKQESIESIRNIAFKVPPENVFEKVLESSPINKTFTYGNNKKATIHSYNILLYDRQLSISIQNNDDLLGFTGWFKDKSYPFVWDLVGTDEKGYSLLMNGDPLDLLQNKELKRSFTLDSSLHRDNNSYSWTVPKKDIINMNKTPDIPIVKNDVIITDKNKTIIYEGLTKFNGSPTIKISINKDQNLNLANLNPERYYQDIPEEYARSFKKNVVSVTKEKKDKNFNYMVLSEESTSKTTFYITFYEDLNNNGIMNIPEENLTISISDLVYSKPLPSKVTIPYKVPKLKPSSNK